MVMPSASSGLPSTAILSPNILLRELTANFEDEEEDFDDWACSKCKFSCVCSAGRPCEMKTPTLFAMVSHMVFSLHLFITLQPDFLSFFYNTYGRAHRLLLQLQSPVLMEFYMTSLMKMKMTMRRLNGIVLNANVATKVKIACVSTAQQKCRMR